MTVTNTNGGYSTCGSCLTAVAAPTLKRFSPTTLVHGTSATITLTGSGFVSGATLTAPGITLGAVKVLSSTQIAVTAAIRSTTKAATLTLTLTNGASGGYGTATAPDFTIT